MECHYCKLQGLHHIGYWVSTCPIIRDILKLEKALPAICAVTGDRTASLLDTGSQVHQLYTSLYTPEQNREAEWLNQTLGDSARTMLRASGLPTSFWSYAYINSRIPNSRTGSKTPLEMWCSHKPQPLRIFPFGAKAVVYIPSEKRRELDDRGGICHLIGFQDDSWGYFFGIMVPNK
ncbi:hypothetical protein O181_097306 [Austropuccinia psidii MF-1]|uniref:Uncharacterized protein n=1 Tax=Austropuccinia psidii MF-1 TaxID=1389203 RepID=A0A9Q3J8S3_9BASI|nr:hypothetical protein [Austropuccinia psidii MF-1]